MAVQFFQTASDFPNFDDPNAFIPNSAGPWSQIQKGRKICVVLTSKCAYKLLSYDITVILWIMSCH